jgi:hypothetical protein
VLPIFFGIDGILYAAPCADFIAMIVAAALTITYFVSLNRSAKQENLENATPTSLS